MLRLFRRIEFIKDMDLANVDAPPDNYIGGGHECSGGLP